jgi:hypothetical protein
MRISWPFFPDNLESAIGFSGSWNARGCRYVAKYEYATAKYRGTIYDHPFGHFWRTIKPVSQKKKTARKGN